MSRVLIADDNPATLRSVQVALELIGFEVVATGEPTRVVELAAEHHVDAAVLDVMMPEMTGYDVVHALRSDPETAAIPVVFLSALGEGSDRVRGLREGADDYMVKPVEPVELALRLERLIERARIDRGEAGEGTTADITAEDFTRLEALLHGGFPVARFPLGRYEIVSLLGEGAAGTVFRAWDSRLHRTVALKTIRLSRPAHDAERNELRDTLMREAVAVARFQDPGIVGIFDIVEVDGIAFIVMEFVNGMNLDRYLWAGGPLAVRDAVPLVAKVTRALAAAHAHRVVHRDLKPANILLGGDGAVKISDFGIAGFLSSLQSDDNEVFGTPGFVPPERIAGLGYDEKGDLFALGVTFYMCLTGVSPFRGDTIVDTVRNTLELEPPSPRSLNEVVPPDLDELIMSLLSKHRGKRPPSAAHVASQLERLVERNGYQWSPAMAVLERQGTVSVSKFRMALIPTGSR